MKVKNVFVILISLIAGFSLNAQDQVDWIEIFEEESGDDIELYAINNGLCPVTINLGFSKIENLKADAKLPIELVLPNDGEEHLITTLSPENSRKGSSYMFNFKYALGNTIDAVHDDSYAYTLPFEKGKSCTLGQGYHGKFSHSNLKALDFDMPVGTEVLAARAGTVVLIKEDSGKGCKNPSCQGLANYIQIYHEDGSFASYVHLKKNGAKVKLGDKVEAGDVIGYSGNTGWSSGPHLHFEVYMPEMQGRKTIKTKFRIKEGTIAFLEEKETYQSK